MEVSAVSPILLVCTLAKSHWPVCKYNQQYIQKCNISNDLRKNHSRIHTWRLKIQWENWCFPLTISAMKIQFNVSDTIHLHKITHSDLKITQMSHLNFEFWHFPPIFDLLKLTCLVTLFDRKLHVFKKSPNWAFLAF